MDITTAARFHWIPLREGYQWLLSKGVMKSIVDEYSSHKVYYDESYLALAGGKLHLLLKEWFESKGKETIRHTIYTFGSYEEVQIPELNHEDLKLLHSMAEFGRPTEEER